MISKEAAGSWFSAVNVKSASAEPVFACKPSGRHPASTIIGNFAFLARRVYFASKVEHTLYDVCGSDETARKAIIR